MKRNRQQKTLQTDTEKLVTQEIEMQKVVFYLGSRGRRTKEAS
jgi:hypothetical protein